MLHTISERIKRQFDRYGLIKRTNLINLVALIIFLVGLVVTMQMVQTRSNPVDIINWLTGIMLVGVGIISIFFWKLKK